MAGKSDEGVRACGLKHLILPSVRKFLIFLPLFALRQKVDNDYSMKLMI
jgi:hypothetical protein